MKSCIIAIVFFISGCATKTEYVKEYVYINKEIEIIKVKEQQKTEKVNLEVKDKSIIISEKDFKILTSNFIIINSYKDYLLTIIKYYEKNVKESP